MKHISMKRILRVSVATVSAAAMLALASCSDDDEEEKFTPQTTPAVSLKTGGALSEEVPISVALSDSAKAKIKVGSDVTSMFVQKAVAASASSARAAVASKSASDSVSTAGEIANFKAEVTAIDGSNITVKFTGTAPESDAKSLIVAAISRDYTADSKDFVRNVKLLNIGSVDATVSEASLNLDDCEAIASDFKGILKNAIGDGEEEYFVFDGSKVTCYAYEIDNGSRSLKCSSEYTFKDGNLVRDGEEKYKTKVLPNGRYGLIRTEEERDEKSNPYKKEGSGLFAKYSWFGKDSGYFCFASDGTIYGEDSYEYENEGEGKTEESTTITGTYINDGGILKTKLSVIEFINGEIFEDSRLNPEIIFDGNTIVSYCYFYDKVDALPESTGN